jgi:hypothetical protein
LLLTAPFTVGCSGQSVAQPPCWTRLLRPSLPQRRWALTRPPTR